VRFPDRSGQTHQPENCRRSDRLCLRPGCCSHQSVKAGTDRRAATEQRIRAFRVETSGFAPRQGIPPERQGSKRAAVGSGPHSRPHYKCNYSPAEGRVRRAFCFNTGRDQHMSSGSPVRATCVTAADPKTLQKTHRPKTWRRDAAQPGNRSNRKAGWSRLDCWD